MLEKKAEFKVVVATSVKKDSYEAGEEVALHIIKKLNGKPDFVLLFSTGDYKKFGGYNELFEFEKTNLCGYRPYTAVQSIFA